MAFITFSSSENTYYEYVENVLVLALNGIIGGRILA
jgi:hypothetical protein